MAQFSSDHGKAPPPRYTPAAGNIGAKAAERALKPGRGQAQAQGRPQPQGGRSGQASLGHPNFDQQDQGGQGQDPEQPKDNGHLELVGAWHNMQGLGRTMPWTVWAGLTGSYRQLAKPGQPMFDIFEDT
jgi:hypothetical protein